ncbi:MULTISPECIES: uroporphyrinogen decarboxylase family protein [Dehalobacter]|uniref:Uroporphyrinogen-III decarboxylase n=2 Tax=Dehalobacter restrictus TaxID=55583 RepID=A0A857DGB7_9FIRM|nr:MULTISPECIES: uroporphyrinogen decarboxylase family protein [Dehalobacter]AHF09321.1 uroporphyrinogen-III decarboxylase [Dehalobacter restrictus DSM 9455]MCG1025218.1 uroporphyrinogen-III decarboxylase [Dehalobacter sp.]MDJ0305808.1 uroporphyrinogen-III decarboxylase [Dehalobacter sp.]OCZ52260.1 uroporphyrinogen-III decarboxylase [Dehalobacter sp. TeCB1]QGZ99862.1 uroporphyrinogen-III decarboxylase [Dehalobacter restrictus]
MNQRENFQVMLDGGKPEFIPLYMELYKVCLLGANQIDQPWNGGLDPFGVNWIATKEGVIPEPNKFLFDDIADWKKYVHFPNIDTLGIEGVAQFELAGCNRDEQIVNVFSTTGLFERLAAFMGFENALCSLIEDPESCQEFFEAMADYKIACHNRFIEVYQPGIITYFDDLATANGLFMSPAVYRSLIKPSHKRIIEAVTSRGVIFAQHTCGRCEEIIEDYVEMGVKIWNAAQISNDLEGIMDKYKGRLIVEGGWDSSGPVSYLGASTEDVIAEALRCAKQYGPKGNYILVPVLMNEKGNSVMVGDDRLGPMIEAWHKVNKL